MSGSFYSLFIFLEVRGIDQIGSFFEKKKKKLILILSETFFHWKKSGCKIQTFIPYYHQYKKENELKMYLFCSDYSEMFCCQLISVEW